MWRAAGYKDPVAQILRRIAVPFLTLSLVLTTLAAPAHAVESDAQIARQWQYAWDFYKFYVCVTEPLPWTGRGTADRDISVDIAAPAAEVFAHYSDFRNHQGANPFLKRLVFHRDTTASGVRTIDLTALEDVPVGGLALEVKTHARQRLHPADLFYEVDSWTLPNVVTHQKIVFTALGPDTTRVTEHLTFEANLLLLDYTVTNGVAAHQSLQTALKSRIESGA